MNFQGYELGKSASPEGVESTDLWWCDIAWSISWILPVCVQSDVNMNFQGYWTTLEGQHGQMEWILQLFHGKIWHSQYPGDYKCVQSTLSTNFQGCVESIWKVGIVRRSWFYSTLVVGYGTINILKVAMYSVQKSGWVQLFGPKYGNRDPNQLAFIPTGALGL